MPDLPDRDDELPGLLDGVGPGAHAHADPLSAPDAGAQLAADSGSGGFFGGGGGGGLFGGGGFDDGGEEPERPRKRSRRGLKAAIVGFVAWLLIAVLVMAPVAVVMQVVLGSKFTKFATGIACKVSGNGADDGSGGTVGSGYPLGKRGTIGSTPEDHRKRALGNWQSDDAVDISVKRGTAVLAVGDGKIVKTGGAAPVEGRGSVIGGYSVTLQTQDDQFFYTHMMTLTVHAGQKVSEGDELGTSGFANGVDHLHIGVEKGDPMAMFADDGGNADQASDDGDDDDSKEPKGKFEGFCDIFNAIESDLGDDADAIRDEIGDELRALLDCSNVSAADRSAGRCIEGLMDTAEDNEDNASPVPLRAQWLVPVWKAAADRYQVPWELLAAINATRTNFGLYNCKPSDVSRAGVETSASTAGVGFYRIPNSGGWDPYRVDAGSAKTETSGNCRKSRAPARLSGRTRTGGNPYDAVDATFTQARILSLKGAKGKQDWAYKGKAPDGCQTPAREGRVFCLPEQTGFGLYSGENSQGIPKDYATLYRSAGVKYKVDWTVLAATGKIETDHGRLKAPGVKPPTTNSYGCCAGPMQFCVIDGCPGSGPQTIPIAQMRGTWAAVGVDGNNDGKRDPFDPRDAIPSAGNYQSKSGSVLGDEAGIRKALFAYNNATWYVNKVLAQARDYGYPSGNTGLRPTADDRVNAPQETSRRCVRGPRASDAVSDAVSFQGNGPQSSACYVAIVNEWYEAIKANPPTGAGGDGVAGAGPKGTRKVTGGGGFVPLPGFPGEMIDKRLIADIKWMVDTYDVFVTDGYATSGHSSAGEHPIGLAIDFGPGRKSAGSWERIGELVKFADPKGAENGTSTPNAPFRWVGYCGDGGTHGHPGCGGNHGHISWEHSPTPFGKVADWVLVMDLDKAASEDRDEK